jgi:glutamate carboxypeptidase
MNKKTLVSLLVACACTAPVIASAQTSASDSTLLTAAEKRKDALVKDLATMVNVDSGTDDVKGLL